MVNVVKGTFTSDIGWCQYRTKEDVTGISPCTLISHVVYISFVFLSDLSSTNEKELYMSECHLCRLYKVHTPRSLPLLCQRAMRCVSLSVHCVCECRL